MKRFGKFTIAFALLLTGCGQSQQVVSLNDYKHPPDTDVTFVPKYNFASFTGSEWRTKVQVGLAEVKAYSGQENTMLLAPVRFDPKSPEFTPAENARNLTILPVGVYVRIDRLIKDNGNWGGLQVTAAVRVNSNSEKIVYLDNRFIEKNKFLWEGWTSSTNWAVVPGLLEK